MWFKKREKEYSPEEAADIVRKELAPFWFRSAPLLCGALMEDGTVNPQPLDPAVRQGIWVLIFTESAGASLLRAKEALKEWDRRYASLGVRFILVFRARYSFFRRRRSAESWLAQSETRAPAFSDPTGLLYRAFSKAGDTVEVYPRIVLLKNGGIVFNASGDGWLDGAERALAGALRETAPGLPLWPEFQETHAGEVDSGRWQAHGASSALPSQKIEFVGKWKTEDDRMITGDPSAEIRFRAPGNQVTIVAQSYTEELTPTRLYFHSHGTYFSDQFAGADFAVDDEARSSVVVSAPRAYSILKNLGDHQREITVQFPNARVTSVAIYALEFSETRDQRK